MRDLSNPVLGVVFAYFMDWHIHRRKSDCKLNQKLALFPGKSPRPCLIIRCLTMASS